MVITLTLPWPPSVNHYFGQKGNKTFITPAGLTFRKSVYIASLPYQKTELFDKKLNLFISAYPPDNRVRDLDNIIKSLQDALQYSLIYKNDFQINDLHVRRMKDNKGCVIVEIDEFLDE